MRNIKKIFKILTPFAASLIMIFTLFGHFGTTALHAEGVVVGSQTVNAGLGVTEVSVSVSVAAGTTVHSVWVDITGVNAMVTDQSLLAGRTFTEPATVPVSIAFVVSEEQQGATFVGNVVVTHSGGTSMGFLTVNADAAPPRPTPTPTPAQTPIIRMSAPTTYIEMAPGVSSIVSVTIENASRFVARDFRIMPRADANFTVEIVGDVPNFTLIANTSRTFQLRITPHHGLESGTHTVVFDYSFENNVREVTTQQGNIAARVYRPAVEEPRVAMTDFAISPSRVNAGDDFIITATLRNTSAVAAANVQLSIGSFAESGLISQGSTTNFLGSMAAGTQRNVDFSFGTGANMDTGSYPITFTLRYDNAAGEAVTENFRFYVTVMGEEEEEEDIETDRARLIITNITWPTGIFEPGQQADFEITVQNNGERAATNLRISAAPETGVVPRLASIQTLSTLAVGQSHTFSFAFSPTSAALSQFYNIGFTVAYDIGQTEDGTAMRDSFEQFSGFLVYNPEPEEDEDDDDEPNRSVPRIIISNYTVEPLIVMANTEFDLYLTIMNTHADRIIRNIGVTWEVAAITVGTEITGGNVFTPVDASNSFFIDAIPPRGTYEHHLRLFAIPDAAPRNHVITIRFEYEDAEGNPFDATASIGVNVRQQSRLELSAMGIPTTVMEGSRVDASITALNAGRSTLFNLRLRLEGEGITPIEEVIGHMQSGNIHAFWANFFATMPGPSTVYLIAQFEDEMGTSHEIIQTFDMEVIGMFGGDFEYFPGGDFDRWPEGGGDFPGMWGDDGIGDGPLAFLTGIWLWLTIGSGVVVAAGVAVMIVVLIKRKRRKNDEFDFDSGNNDLS